MVKFVKISSTTVDMRAVVIVCVFVVLWEYSATSRTQYQCPSPKLRFGRVRTRQRGRLAKFVCNTGYILAGDKYSTCVRNEWDNPPPKCVRSTCKKVTPPANGLIYPSHGGGVLHFYCNSNFELRGPNITYCDGTKWDNNRPTCVRTKATPLLFCDFETEDICGWSHDLNHDFDWRRLNFNTPSSSIGTGPSFDHTKGPGKDGYYMYIESSSRSENDTARLISPVYDKTANNTCLEFFYHMYGSTTGDLRVYLKKITQDWNLDVKSAIFNKRGNQGDHWYRSFHQFGAIDDDYQIVVEGIRGPGYVSDMAVDDIKLIENCVYDDEEEISTSTQSNDETSEPPPMTVESCENRCDTNSDAGGTVDTNVISCDCDDRCVEHNRCCPDYFDFCAFQSTAADSNSIEDFTESTIIPSNNLTIVDRLPDIRTEQMNKITLAPIKPVVIQFEPSPTNIAIYQKIPNTQTSNYADHATRSNDRDDRGKSYDDIATLPSITTVKDDNDVIDIFDGQYTKKVETIKQKIINLKQDTKKSARPNLFVILLIVLAVFVMVVSTVFVLKRYRRGYLKASSNGDSQSDVRYLTGDEILDFSLPTGHSEL